MSTRESNTTYFRRSSSSLSPNHPMRSRQHVRRNRQTNLFRRFLIGAAWVVILLPAQRAWSQKNLPTVRLGIEAISGTNSHYYVTSKLGLFQKHGVNMELIAFPGGTVGLQALLAGDIQFATEDGLAGLQANLRGANLQFLAGMINSFPFLILSKPEIRVPGDLRGKKIAISRYGSSSDTAVRAVMERYKLRPDKDVVILQGGGQTERFAALRAGAVDAAIVSPPLNLAGRALGLNEVIDFSESGIPYAHQEIVAQKDFIDRNPDLVMRTLRGLIEGQAQWKDKAKKGVIIGLVAKYLRLDPEKNRDQIEETYRYYSKIFSSKPYATLEGVEFTAQILKKNLPEAKDLQAKDYVNNRFVGQLEKEGFLARVYGGR